MSNKGTTYNPRKRKAFTETNVLALKPQKLKQYLTWDEGTEAARGLAILVSPRGTKSYRCAYYLPGDPKAHFKHLGRVGEISLTEARQNCRETRAMALRNEDPKADDPKKSDNFETAIEEYIAKEQRGKKRNTSADETKAVMQTSCTAWRTRPVATIRYKEIEDLLCLMRDGDATKGLRARPYLANRLYSHLKSFFAWYVKRHPTLKTSPMQVMEKPWDGAKPREKDWFKGKAGDDAIRALWRAAGEISGTEGQYIKLMLLTGKRKTALAGMLWEEVDDAWFWDPPPSTAKNKRLHGVPLPTLAQRLLHPRQQKGRVFGTCNLDQLQRAVRERAGINDFIWHGVRHLAETKTAELRDKSGRSVILPHIRDLLFDHVSARGSGAGYDHHDYKAEMRDAMEAWADYVERLVSPAGVAMLK